MEKQEHSMLKTLRAEHRHMGSVLKLFTEQLDALEQGDFVDSHVVYEIMDYITTWPDSYHHPREDLIYARVAELDAQSADDVDTLQRDHDFTARKGKKLLVDIAKWQEGKFSNKKLVKDAREYTDHVFEHMEVEEKIVFPHIQAMLTLEDWRELSSDNTIKAVSKPLFTVPVQREYLKLSRKMRRSARRAVETSVLGQMAGIDTTLQSLDVLSMARKQAGASARERAKEAIDDSRDFFQRSLMTAPGRCAFNNLRLTFEFLGDLKSIQKGVSEDLGEIGQEYRERMKLVTSADPK